MNSVTRRREIKRNRLPIRHLEQIFKDNRNINIDLLARFQSELDLEIVEIRTPERRFVF
jgi:hypothetical protein